MAQHYDVTGYDIYPKTSNKIKISDTLAGAVKDKDILVFDDASHALGSKFSGKMVGEEADLTIFSFFPTKNITTGEGGAVACKDPKILQKARRFARQGLVRDSNEFKITTEGPWHQEIHQFGLNYRLPDILAALGSSQLTRINEFKSKRKEIFDFYSFELGQNINVKLPTVRDFAEPFWHLFPIRVPADKRLKVFSELRNSGINVQVNYFPVNRQPVFDRNLFNDCPVAFSFYQCEISLPIFYDLNEFDLKSICSLLLKNLR